jgi:hypothetical protein
LSRQSELACRWHDATARARKRRTHIPLVELTPRVGERQVALERRRACDVRR